MSDPSCLFCKIAAKAIPAEVVYEDDKTIAFLDVHPRALGHAVVISKHHSSAITDLPDAEIEPLFRTVKKVADRALKAFRADGLTIGINHGSVSGQSVEHLHVHVIPRFEKDEGGSIHSVVNKPPQESVAEAAEKYRAQK